MNLKRVSSPQATWWVILACFIAGVGIYLWYFSGRHRHAHADMLPHRHQSSLRGGVIVPVGADHFHAEVWLATRRQIKLFTLGQDERLIETVPEQTFTVYLRSGMTRNTIQTEFRPVRQSTDPPGQVSQFEAELSEQLPPGAVTGLVPSINWGARTYRIAFSLPEELTPAAEVAATALDE